MNTIFTRRHFFKTTAASGALLGLGDFSFLKNLPRVSAAEAQLDPQRVRVGPEIEPLVRLLEETPRERLLEEIGGRIRRGLSYRQILAALLLAGVRNIQPRPVGYKFHAVLVVNSAHLASLASPPEDRWLPIFWALDYFKSSQKQDALQGDWKMGPVEEARVPAPDKARAAFKEAMNQWDEAGADAAVVGLTRSAGAQEVFNLFAQYGARDYRDIGHKAIFVANSWRTLQCIGWHHAEPVLRSLAYALLAHEGGNPANREATADQPGRRNRQRLKEIQPGWAWGRLDRGATAELVQTLRQGSPDEASDKVVRLLNQGIAPQSVWDALFDTAGEWLIRRPGIVALHAVTCTNAIHYAYQQAADDETRRYLLLQNSAFLPLFRGNPDRLKEEGMLDRLEPAEVPSNGSEALREIFADVSRDRLAAARKALAYLQDHPQPEPFIETARKLIFLKGSNSHDYKFSSAVLEDYYHVSKKWRAPYLAASVYNLRGSEEPDNDLVTRTRAALNG